MKPSPSLRFNVRHLESHPVRLQGEVDPEELELDPQDAMLRVRGPLRFDLEVEQVADGALVTGRLEVTIDCTCVRCLKEYEQRVTLDHWTRHLAFSGEEAATPVHDLVDLTPWVREDILLAFPQHPLCERGCSGLPRAPLRPALEPDPAPKTTDECSVWSELNKLKF